jgi:hypothetical protein
VVDISSTQVMLCLMLSSKPIFSGHNRPINKIKSRSQEAITSCHDLTADVMGERLEKSIVRLRNY